MLSVWNPRQAASIEQLFDDIFKDKSMRQHYQKTYSPNINVRETKDKVIVEAEIAGLTKDEVKVKFETGALKISGEKKFEKVEEDAQYYAKEIKYGSFKRVIPINEDYINADSITANFKNGILTVEIDKAEKKKSKEIEIQIS